ALSDAVIGAAEPETMVELAWPDALLVNGGVVGGGRLAWPHGIGDDEVPPWLVFGAMIRLQPQSQREPGDNPNVTNLAEEGFGGALLEESGGGLLSQRLVESFSRHFMVALDAWQEHGFAAVAREYLARLPRAPGQRRDIADNGDLLTRRMASEVDERQSFVAALAAPSWLDPATGAPR
ncbi:MAG TPA: biotin/lipoate--protein ligase family protein, partial [Pseudolabrys sp.]|nr:biotin/lipoate--protein ligase family protein [Pseudolabrys sp.]